MGLESNWIYKLAVSWWHRKTPRLIRVFFYKFLEKFSVGKDEYQKIELQGKTYVEGVDRSRSYRQLFPFPPISKTILDVGCSYGYYSLMAAQAEAKYCLALDMDQIYTNKLREVVKDMGLKNLDVVQNNIFDYTINMNFDIVLCLNVIHHFEKIEQVEILLETLYQHTLEKMVLIVLAPHDPKQLFIMDKEPDLRGGKRFLRISTNYFIAKYGQTHVRVMDALTYGPFRNVIIIEKRRP